MTPTQRAAIKGMLAYFDSGNSVPVGVATIKADCAEVASLRAALAEPAPVQELGLDDQPKDCGPECEDGPDEDGFSGPRPWNSYAAPVQEPIGWYWEYNGRPEGKVFFGKTPDQDVIERGLSAEFPCIVRYVYAAPQAQQPAPVQEPTCKQPLQVHKPTGWMAHKNQYAVPVLFNPYTGEPRDVRDVQSDPQGILIVPPGKVEMLAAQQPALTTCNCRWDGETQVQQCTLHESHFDAIHEWAERAKTAEKLAQQPAPPADVPMLTPEEIDAALHVALPSLSYDSEDAFITGVRVGEKLVRQKAGLP